jgi:glycosyltransferase involved in cell wall biosynthesis
MKILINALSARQGGGQTYLANLMRALPEQEDIVLYVLAPEALIIPVSERIVKLSVPNFTSSALLRAVWESVRIPAIIFRYQIDVLFCPGGLINNWVPRSCATVTMFRNMIPFDPRVTALYPVGYQRVRNWLLKRSMLRSMQQADLVIFISDYARSIVQEAAKSKCINGVTIPHGLGDRFKMPDQWRKNPIPSVVDTEYILYVSLFERYKNHLNVVEGFYKLIQARNTKERLVLAGLNEMPMGPIVKKRILELGLGDSVVLLGSVPYESLPSLYANAKVNIFASECENCPNILLEAMGAGRPTIVSESEPMPEFGGDAVVYFDPRSPLDLCEKMLGVIDNQTLMEKLGAQSAERARVYDWSFTASKTWAEMARLLPL